MSGYIVLCMYEKKILEKCCLRTRPARHAHWQDVPRTIANILQFTNCANKYKYISHTQPINGQL